MPEANVPLLLMVFDDFGTAWAGPPAFSGAGVVDLAPACCPGACSTLSSSSSWALPVTPANMLNSIKNHLCKSSFRLHYKYFLQMCRECFKWLHIASCELELLLQTSSWVTFCTLECRDLFLWPLQCFFINCKFLRLSVKSASQRDFSFCKSAFGIHSFVILFKQLLYVQSLSNGNNQLLPCFQ